MSIFRDIQRAISRQHSERFECLKKCQLPLIKGVGGGLGVKILFDLVATYFKNLGYREVGTFYRIEKANPVAKF